MSTATLSRVMISAVLRDGRIELRGPFDETLNEFYSSLPGGRWDRKRSCWTCHVTPACCWRITSQAPCSVEAEEKIRQIGHRFYEPVLRPSDDGSQPTIRNKDAWRHQVAAYHFAKSREASLLSMAMGTGKSLVTIQLAENWNCRRVLILCPVSVMGVWRREFAKHATQAWAVTILDRGSLAKKVAVATLDSSGAEARGEPWVCIINYESAKLFAFADWSFRQKWGLVVCDESQRIKGQASQASKYAAEVAKDSARRLCLSGTPMSHSPLDLFGQFRFLDPGIFGTSYHRFRSTFAISGPFGADHIVGFKNQDELARRMALITYEVDSSVLDLPAVTHVDIQFELGKEARRLYDEMEGDLIAFVKGGGEVTAGNGLVKLLRLQQICSGFIEDDQEQIHEVGTEKRDTLADLLSDIEEPTVAFCVFHRQLDAIRHVGESLKRRVGEISGRHKDLTDRATMPEDVDLMATQIRSGGVGIDLTRARIGVYVGVCYSLGDYEQSIARLNRPGQTKPCVFYHLVGVGTIDEAIYRALDKKREVINEVMKYLRGEAE